MAPLSRHRAAAQEKADEIGEGLALEADVLDEEALRGARDELLDPGSLEGRGHPGQRRRARLLPREAEPVRAAESGRELHRPGEAHHRTYL